MPPRQDGLKPDPETFLVIPPNLFCARAYAFARPFRTSLGPGASGGYPCVLGVVAPGVFDALWYFGRIATSARHDLQGCGAQGPKAAAHTDRQGGVAGLQCGPGGA